MPPQLPSLTRASGTACKGMLVTPANTSWPEGSVCGADGPMNVVPSMCHAGLQPSRMEVASTAVEGQHCCIQTAGSIHAPFAISFPSSFSPFTYFSFSLIVFFSSFLFSFLLFVFLLYLFQFISLFLSLSPFLSLFLIFFLHSSSSYFFLSFFFLSLFLSFSLSLLSLFLCTLSLPFLSLCPSFFFLPLLSLPSQPPLAVLPRTPLGCHCICIHPETLQSCGQAPGPSSNSELICQQQGALIEDLPPPLPSLQEHEESSDVRGKKSWGLNHLCIRHLPGTLALCQGKSPFSLPWLGGGCHGAVLALAASSPALPSRSIPSPALILAVVSRAQRCF